MKIHNPRPLKLLEYCRNLRMNRFNIEKTYIYTWTQNIRGIKLAIDYRIVTLKVKMIIQDIGRYRGVLLESGHHQLHTKITFEENKP